jgi:hypothetical protein
MDKLGLAKRAECDRCLENTNAKNPARLSRNQICNRRQEAARIRKINTKTKS